MVADVDIVDVVVVLVYGNLALFCLRGRGAKGPVFGAALAGKRDHSQTLTGLLQYSYSLSRITHYESETKYYRLTRITKCAATFVYTDTR